MKKTNFSNIVKKIDDVESYRKDLKKVLINLKDISTRKHNKCVICSSRNIKDYFKYLHITYKECLKCQTIFIADRPDVKSLNLFYKKLYENSHFINDLPLAKRKQRIEKIMKPRWNFIKERIKSFNNKTIKNYLEIGPGIGYFSELAVKDKISTNYDLVEPDKKAAFYLKKIFKNNNKIKIFNCLYEELLSSTLYDLIFINSVIEHPHDLKKFFKKISFNLKKNGLFVLTDMNSTGIDVQVLKELTPNYNPYTILQVTSKKGINQLCKLYNMELLETFSIGEMDIDIIYEYEQYYNKSFNKSFLMKLFESSHIRSMFQNVLKQNEMTGYNLYIIKKIA